jgi:hypothetical protein
MAITPKKPVPQVRGVYLKQVSELGYVLVETDGVTETVLGDAEIKPLVLRRAHLWLSNNISRK